MQRNSAPLRLPARISLMRLLNGLSVPSWVLMTCTSPPQMSSANAALSSSASSPWKAASSITTTPWRPRRLLGREVRAVTRNPDGKVML
ncbi:hypothetical protein D3C78_1581890 [compost metagenome]